MDARWRHRLLQFVVAGSSARIAPTWYPDGGRFAHWYVDFVTPAERWAGGTDSMDLVLDILVAPDATWSWKDRDDFDAAVARGILERTLDADLQQVAAGVLDLLHHRAGPFDPAWPAWRPPPSWPTPALPPDFAAGVDVPEGAALSLDP